MKIMDGNVYINEAMVIVADLEADNGVVHVIDAVILPTATSIERRVAEIDGVSVYPNPAREFVNIRYNVVKESNVSLEMYNITGKQVAYKNLGNTYEGEHTSEFSVGTLEAGMYLLIINTGDSQVANKVRVVK